MSWASFGRSAIGPSLQLHRQHRRQPSDAKRIAVAPIERDLDDERALQRQLVPTEELAGVALHEGAREGDCGRLTSLDPGGHRHRIDHQPAGVTPAKLALLLEATKSLVAKNSLHALPLVRCRHCDIERQIAVDSGATLGRLIQWLWIQDLAEQGRDEPADEDIGTSSLVELAEELAQNRIALRGELKPPPHRGPSRSCLFTSIPTSLSRSLGEESKSIAACHGETTDGSPVSIR